MNEITKYQQETVNQYHQRFGEQVVRLRNELAKKKRTNAQLDEMYREPSSPLEVRRIAEHLDALAQTLP
jgi:hypothetical protein